MPRCWSRRAARSVIGLRFLTGASLALVYPPAMKIAAGWFRDGRGFALGLLIGALTLGKAFPHLLTALFGAEWREPMLLASGLAIIGGTLVVLIVRDGPFVAPTAPFDPHAIRNVLASRGARLATLGYLGHMWELYAMWTWVAVFATASFAASGVAGASSAGSHRGIRRDRQRRRGLRARRLHRRSHRQSSRRDVGNAVQRRLRGADARRLRTRRRGCCTR